jgi:hypothetical protein
MLKAQQIEGSPSAMQSPKEQIIRGRPIAFEGAVTVALGLIAAVYFVVLDLPLNRIFLLVEYRHWVLQPELLSFLTFFDPSKIFQSDAFNIASSRATSLFLAAVFGKACGYNATCHNLVHLSMIVATALFAALAVRALSSSRSWLPSVVTAGFFVLSVPVFDALSWQATLLDKTSALLGSLMVLLAARVSVKDVRLSKVALANLAFFLLVVLAYNAKEAALFLMPAVALLLLIRAFGVSGNLLYAIKQTLRLSIVALLYAGFHVAVVVGNRFLLAPGELSRVTGGNMAFNLEYYARYLLNLMGNYSHLQLGLGIAAVVVMAAVALICSARNRNSATGWLVAWSLLGFLGSFVIPLRTSATAPFYLLVPLLFLALFFGLVLEALLANVGNRMARMAVIALAVVVFVTHAMTLRSFYPSVLDVVDLSDNFNATLVKTSEEFKRDRPTRLVFIRPVELQRAYMFLSSPGDVGHHALAQYVLPNSASMGEILSVDDSIVDIASNVSEPLRSGDLRILLDGRLRLVGMERGPRS